MQFLSKFQWYFLQKKKINLKICIESQKTLNTQGNLKENKGGGIMPLISNYILQNYTSQNSMALAQK